MILLFSTSSFFMIFKMCLRHKKGDSGRKRKERGREGEIFYLLTDQRWTRLKGEARNSIWLPACVAGIQVLEESSAVHPGRCSGS